MEKKKKGQKEIFSIPKREKEFNCETTIRKETLLDF
jgi:hypothetical protein